MRSQNEFDCLHMEIVLGTEGVEGDGFGPEL